MLKKRITEVFFFLLRSGLWEENNLDLTTLPLSEEEWAEIYKISVNQTVECIVFDGIQKLSAENQPPKALLLSWAVRVEKHGQRNELMNDTIIQLHSVFKQNGIEPILLKGQGIAKCYDNPLRRVCGDIDLFFDDKITYEKAFKTIKDKEIEISSMAGFSAEYKLNGFDVEHHQNLFDIHNPFVHRVLRRIREHENTNYTTLNINNQTVKLPSVIETIIQANSHILKHLLSFGIGIRQLCDSARLYYYYHKDLKNNSLDVTYKKLGIKKWVDLLHVLLVKYIGLKESYLPYSIGQGKEADWMMEDILVAGNFGFHNEKFQDKESLLDGIRVNKKARIWNNFIKYVKVTPSEAIWFPIMQYYSRFKR